MQGSTALGLVNSAEALAERLVPGLEGEGLPRDGGHLAVELLRHLDVGKRPWPSGIPDPVTPGHSQSRPVTPGDAPTREQSHQVQSAPSHAPSRLVTASHVMGA